MTARRLVLSGLLRMMRAAGLTRQIEIRTAVGTSFSGVLPEFVTGVIWRDGVFERDVSDLVCEIVREGDVAIDVGAHFGYFSILFARLAGPRGHVVAVEPSDEARDFLLRNIDRNAGGAPVSPVASAAGETGGVATLKSFGLIYSSLNSRFEPREQVPKRRRAHQFEVPVKTIDGLAAEYGLMRIDLIKIDAESSEADVIRGARGVLAEHKPVLIVEVGDVGAEGASDEVIDLVRSLGYDTYLLDRGRLCPAASFAGRYGALCCWPEGQAPPTAWTVAET